MPDGLKAERIEGLVYMAGATSADFHAVPHAELMAFFVWYKAMTRGVEVADNGTIHLDLDNDPQPDGSMYILPHYGGQIQMDKKGFIVGAPELVAEISGSSVSYDLNTKLRVYRRNGVREYLIHRVYDGAIDWFSLREDQYEQIPVDADGIIRSRAFPGLWLNPTALVERELAEVLRVLQLGLASQEHAEFVRRLAGTQA